MQKKIFLALACSTVIHSACASQNVTAQETVSANCSESEYRQLDFWIGEWDLSWKQADGSIGSGSNVIRATPYGNCVITENFDGQPTMALNGLSVSTYHKPSGLWRQTWVDNTGGYFSLFGGPLDNDEFALEMERLNDQGPHRRMIWKNIETDSLDWHWQGRNNVAESWNDLWVIQYKRR